MTVQKDPRPDQHWNEHRANGEVLDPAALRRGELVPDMSPEERAARDVEAQQLEGSIEERLRQNAADALQAQADLLARMEHVATEDLPSALRATTDVASKNVDGLFKVTGRDRPQQEGMVDMLSAMAQRGYVKLNVELGRPLEPPPDELDP